MLDTRKTGLIQHNPPSLSRNELYESAAPVETKPGIRVKGASKIDRFGIAGQDIHEFNSETVITVPRMVQQPALPPRPLALENADFGADLFWTKGTGWTIANGKASSDASQAGDSDLTQTPVPALAASRSYSITIEVTDYVAGNVTPVVGDVEGTDRAANGTFTETIIAGAGADVDLRADVTFDGSITFVSIERIGGDFDVGEHVVLAADAVGDNQAGPGQIVINGKFAADTDWTKGTGWIIAAGVASSDASQAGDSDLTNIGPATVAGVSYQITFTISNYVAGNVTPVIGGTEGTDRAANGTFTEIIIDAGAGTDIDIRADLDFDGDIDNVEVTAVPLKQWQLDAVDIVGENDARLILANIQIADSGSYTCDFTNAAGKTSSAAAVVIVT